MNRDRLLQRRIERQKEKARTHLIKGVGYLVLGIAILLLIVIPRLTRAQGGYYVTEIMPQPGMILTDGKFYLDILNVSTGQTERWVMNIAGYVIWDDPTRAPEYLVLRIDNLVNIADLCCVELEWTSNSSANPIPTEDLPPPTYFIWNEETLAQYDIHYIPIEE